MRKVIVILCSIVYGTVLFGETQIPSGASKSDISARYGTISPTSWGQSLPGVITHFNAESKCVALTFDACGSPKDACDWRLIHFLQKKHIPATLFISGRWIEAHPGDFSLLAADHLFEIENHGQHHKPCSVNGRKAYGIEGTKNPGEVFDEIDINGHTIERLTGVHPRFYRSGTAYYDDVGIKIAHELGFQIIGFNVLGDAGATFSSQQVKKALLSARPGSIIICHMNHPTSGTAQGVIDAVPVLIARGYSFVALKDCHFK